MMYKLEDGKEIEIKSIKRRQMQQIYNKAGVSFVENAKGDITTKFKDVHLFNDLLIEYSTGVNRETMLDWTEADCRKIASIIQNKLKVKQEEKNFLGQSSQEMSTE